MIPKTHLPVGIVLIISIVEKEKRDMVSEYQWW